MSDCHNVDPKELEERRLAFNAFWMREMDRLGVGTLSPKWQGIVHESMKRAFREGMRYERKRNEPIKVGGHD